MSTELYKMGDEEELVEPDEGTSRLRSLRLNLFWICLIWVFTFTAYSGLQNLEASLVPQYGVYSLAALTGGGLVSCIVAPAVIAKIGAKWALFASWICLAIFVGANYYPKPYVLLPGAAIEGLSTGLMWTAQGTFVTTIAMEYAQIIDDTLDSVLSRFFGIFCMAFQSTQIWGNIISSGVLHESKPGGPANGTEPPSFCGADDCPGDQAPGNATEKTIQLPAQWRIDLLISIYLGFTVIGLLITTFLLKPLKKPANAPAVNIGRQLLATLKLLVTNLNMALLVPLSLYSGMEQVILYAEFTKAYVACELGIGYVGLTMICFGVVNTVGSPLVGVLGKYTGRLMLGYIAMGLNLGTLAVLRFWKPEQDEVYIFFIIPGVWGLADAIWQTQSGALIGSIFSDNQEPGYANLRLFQALGFTIAYLYSNFLCEYIKLYITAGVVIVSVILWTIVEIRVKISKQPKQMENIIN